MSLSEQLSSNESLNEAICPLCGQPNNCAMAIDPEATMCWCEMDVFPEELLAQIPEKAVRKTCVCKKCLDKYQELINSTDFFSAISTS